MSFVAVTVDPACGVDEGEAARACLAVDEQARELAALYGVEYTPVIFFSWDVLEKLSGDDLTNFVAGARLCIVRPDIGVPGALGFHSDVGGVIFARVKFGPDWTVALSHEVLEQELDPACDAWMPLEDGREQAAEACDRVEGDTYRVGDVLVSNYLLPAAFVPDSAGPWDKLAQLTRWNDMTGGGYMIVRNADGSEVDVFAETDHAQARADRKRARVDTRLARRLAGPPDEVSGQASQNEETDVVPTRDELAAAEEELAARTPAKPNGKGRGKRKRAA